jgi:hypothetical protein
LQEIKILCWFGQEHKIGFASSAADPGCLFLSRIQQQQKREGGKTVFSSILVAINFTKLKIN